jgi:hypothetical protein
LLFDLCKSMWGFEVLVNLPSPILELQHAPLPPKCCEPRSVPQLFILLLFSLQTHIWVYQGAWDHVNIFLALWMWRWNGKNHTFPKRFIHLLKLYSSMAMMGASKASYEGQKTKNLPICCVFFTLLFHCFLCLSCASFFF